MKALSRFSMNTTLVVVALFTACSSDSTNGGDSSDAESPGPDAENLDVLSGEDSSSPPDAGPDAQQEEPLAGRHGRVGGDGLYEWPDPVAWPACGSGSAMWQGLIPGPGMDSHDAELAAKARRIERQFHGINTTGVGVNRMLSVALDEQEARAAIESFVLGDDGWDFEAATGVTPDDVVSSWSKTAGAYAGVGSAADAMRYAVMRAEGADCDELERARDFVRGDLDALHLAMEITGEPGVIARGFARSDQPGAPTDIVPLFDEAGNPLPEDKNNGTWRADNSGGLYPNYVWEDSCSRDMLIGWVIGMAMIWEVIEHDPEFDDALKRRLRDDALALVRSLMTVQESGFDLEVRDADGRRTYHGILHEESIDRAYVPGARVNGFNAIMSLGIVSALEFIVRDAEVTAYLYDELIGERRLHELARDQMNGLDLGYASNFSGYNMAFQGGWLSLRYVRDAEAVEVLRGVVQHQIYDRGEERQPREQGQTFYDLVYLASVSGESAFRLPDQVFTQDELASFERGLQSLVEWRDVPTWNVSSENCDESELESGDCVAADGTAINVLGAIGRNDTVVAESPIPMRVRGPSNYWWRSNPYRVDLPGDGSVLLPSSDFRFAYWMGRYLLSPDA